MTGKSNLLSFDGLYLSINFETPHYLSEYVEYSVRVSYSVNEILPGDSYVIVKRYSDFDNLRKAIKQTNLPVQLPPKKLFGKFDMALVNQRQIMLEKFLKCVLNIPLISKSVPVTNFFQKDNENIADYSKIGFQQVSLDFRCETTWLLGKTILEMGCRIKKSYISVTNTTDQRNYVLNWSEFGSEYSPLNFKAVYKLLKLLPTIKHEFIYPIIYTNVNDTSVSVIRPLSEIGSLHDYMLKVKPTNSIECKYGYQTSYPTLVHEISLFGRQILTALKYLHDKGWPYGHLHIRNVLMISNEKCALTDIENSLIGLWPQDRHFYVGILKKLTFEEIDIYCFGRLIFHMVFGYPLESTFIVNDDKLRWPSPSIREFLFAVLTENVLKSGFPTIDQIFENSIFKSFNTRIVDKGPLKLSDSSKEFLATTHQYSLKLLIVDQKLVKSQRRKMEADVFEIKKKQQRKEDLRRAKNSIEISNYGDIADNTVVESKSIPTVVRQTTVSRNSKIPDTNNNISKNNTPLPPPVPGPPSLPPPSSSNVNGTSSKMPDSDPGRHQLLNVISGFNKNNLRKTKTNDRSVPRI